jgi:hypothetical protein
MPASVIQRDIALTLKAGGGIPRGLSMADQKQAKHVDIQHRVVIDGEAVRELGQPARRSIELQSTLITGSWCKHDSNYRPYRTIGAFTLGNTLMAIR